ncbi:MAG: 2Fe-2S iron-sulfur cluster binding domain-containing protein [Spirochaetaceae bacterium]|jgi:carbon-monoxide dehydrogenase small subunit|nr:2Fe-2S iron-sulfur cluster binding domain-containing protein [Spirochaetaceae bacterium]
MTIGFILNGEDVTIRTEADVRLLDILRETFKLFGAKCGCLTGACGVCSVIFNGKVVPSCLIPAFRIRGCEIITIEGFSQNDEYQDILRGFSQAGLENCGYCDAGKILAVEALLEKIPRPSKADINAAFSGIRCRCTDPDRLVEGVLLTADIRQRRLYGRST